MYVCNKNQASQNCSSTLLKIKFEATTFYLTILQLKTYIKHVKKIPLYILKIKKNKKNPALFSYLVDNARENEHYAKENTMIYLSIFYNLMIMLNILVYIKA